MPGGPPLIIPQAPREARPRLWTPWRNLSQNDVSALWYAGDPSTVTVNAAQEVIEWRDMVRGLRATSDVSTRPVYDRNNAVALGRPAIVFPSTSGAARLLVSSPPTYSAVFVVAAYGVGTETVFDNFNALFGRETTEANSRWAGTDNGSVWLSSYASGSISKNGAAASTTALPLPLSAMYADGADNVTPTGTWTLGNNTSVANRSWIGPITAMIFLRNNISAQTLALLEGWAAWDGPNGFAHLLPATHQFRHTPPYDPIPARVRPRFVFLDTNVGGTTITGAEYVSSAQFGAGTVIGDQVVTGTEYLSTAQFGAGTLTQTISATSYAPATQYGAGTVAQTILAAEYAPATQCGAGTVTVFGAGITITGTEYAPATQYGAGTLLVDQIITGTSYAAATQYGVGTLTQIISATPYVSTAQYGAGDILFPQTIYGTEFLSYAAYGSGTVADLSLDIRRGRLHIIGQAFVHR